MTSETFSVALGPTIEFWVCACCYGHADTPLQAGEPVTCPTCHLPCSCEGCRAEAD